MQRFSSGGALPQAKRNVQVSAPRVNSSRETISRPNISVNVQPTPQPNRANRTPQPNRANRTPQPNRANRTPQPNRANRTPQPNNPTREILSKTNNKKTLYQRITGKKANSKPLGKFNPEKIRKFANSVGYGNTRKLIDDYKNGLLTNDQVLQKLGKPTEEQVKTRLKLILINNDSRISEYLAAYTSGALNDKEVIKSATNYRDQELKKIELKQKEIQDETAKKLNRMNAILRSSKNENEIMRLRYGMGKTQAVGLMELLKIKEREGQLSNNNKTNKTLKELVVKMESLEQSVKKEGTPDSKEDFEKLRKSVNKLTDPKRIELRTLVGNSNNFKNEIESNEFQYNTLKPRIILFLEKERVKKLNGITNEQKTLVNATTNINKVTQVETNIMKQKTNEVENARKAENAKKAQEANQATKNANQATKNANQAKKVQEAANAANKEAQARNAANKEAKKVQEAVNAANKEAREAANKEAQEAQATKNANQARKAQEAQEAREVRAVKNKNLIKLKNVNFWTRKPIFTKKQINDFEGRYANSKSNRSTIRDIQRNIVTASKEKGRLMTLLKRVGNKTQKDKYINRFNESDMMNKSGLLNEIETEISNNSAIKKATKSNEKNQADFAKMLNNVNTVSQSRQSLIDPNNKKNLIANYNKANAKRREEMRGEIKKRKSSKLNEIKKLMSDTDKYEKLLKSTKYVSKEPIFNNDTRKTRFEEFRKSDNKDQLTQELIYEIEKVRLIDFQNRLNDSILTKIQKSGIKGRYSTGNKNNTVEKFVELVKQKTSLNGISMKLLNATYAGKKKGKVFTNQEIKNYKNAVSRGNDNMDRQKMRFKYDIRVLLRKLMEMSINISDPETKTKFIEKIVAIENQINAAKNVNSMTDKQKGLIIFDLNKLEKEYKTFTKKSIFSQMKVPQFPRVFPTGKNVKKQFNTAENMDKMAELYEKAKAIKMGIGNSENISNNLSNLRKIMMKASNVGVGKQRGGWFEETINKISKIHSEVETMVPNIAAKQASKKLVTNSIARVISKGENEEKEKIIKNIGPLAKNKSINMNSLKEKSVKNLRNLLGELRVQAAYGRQQAENRKRVEVAANENKKRKELVVEIQRLSRKTGGAAIPSEIFNTKTMNNLLEMKQNISKRGNTEAATKIQAAQRGFKARLKMIEQSEKKVSAYKPPRNRQNIWTKKMTLLKTLEDYKKPPITSTDMSEIREQMRELEKMKKGVNDAEKIIAEKRAKQADENQKKKETQKRENEAFKVKYTSFKSKEKIIFENNKVPDLIKYISNILPSEIKTEDNLRKFGYTSVDGTQKILHNTNMNQIKKNITNVKQKEAAVRQKEANVEAEAKKQKEANAEAVRRQKEANVEAEAKKQKEAAKRQKEANAEANAKTAAGRAVDIRKGELIKLLSTKNLESRKKNGFYLRIKNAKTIQELEKIHDDIKKTRITESRINTGRSKPRGQTGRSMLKYEQQNSKKIVRTGGRASE
jgi:hypothetical protein